MTSPSWSENRALTQRAIDSLAEGLRHHGISREAAEDPSILLRHIERVAEKVHRILRRPAEHPPVDFVDEDDFGGPANPEANEKLWDELEKQNRRQQERMLRAIDERRRGGLDEKTAFQDALGDIISDILDDETERLDEPWRDDGPPPFSESLVDENASFGEAADDSIAADVEERHPLLQRAMDLLEHLHSLFRDMDLRLAPSLGLLYQGAGDAMGGLAQALSHREHDADDNGLRIVQLKRALRGAAFARGALFPLRSTFSAEQFDELFRTLQQMETDIVSELGKVRFEHRGDEW